MVRGALVALLEMEGDIEVVAQASNGAEAISAVAAFCPDVLITDIEMPEMGGLDVATLLKRHSPMKIVILTTFERLGYLQRALQAGVAGYLLKDRPAKELADAVRRVHRGQRVVDADLAAEALGAPNPLSGREREVLRLAGDGVASGDIARRLGLSVGTVRNYLSDAIGKLGADNRVDAARIARDKGWL